MTQTNRLSAGGCLVLLRPPDLIHPGPLSRQTAGRSEATPRSLPSALGRLLGVFIGLERQKTRPDPVPLRPRSAHRKRDLTPNSRQILERKSQIRRGYIGDEETFVDLMVEYVHRYADITERDHAQVREAIDDGPLEVVRDI